MAKTERRVAETWPPEQRAPGDAAAPALSDVCAAIDQMPGGVCRGVIDGDGQVRFEAFTAGGLALLGLEADELVGPADRLLTQIWVDDLEERQHAFLEHGVEGRAWTSDLRLRIGGRRLWVRVAATFDVRADGEIGFTAIGYDITGHRHTADALALSDAGFRAMLRSNRQAFVLLDADQRVLAFNEVAEEFASRRKQVLRLGESFEDVIPSDLRARHLEWFAAALRGEAHEAREERVFPDAERRVLDMACAPVLDRTGRSLGVAWSAIDVSRQVANEQAVVESDRILSRLPLAVFTVSRGGAIQRARGAVPALLGLDLAAAEGRSLGDILAPEERTRRWPLIAEALRDRRPLRVEVDAHHQDGTLVPVEMTLSPVAEGDPLAGHIVVMLEDVAPRRALQRQLVESHKMEAVGLLAAGLAHDFNNLLAAIVGHTAMLDLDLPEADPLRAEVAGIEATTRRAATLVRSLLGLARQRSGGARPVELHGVLTRALPMLVRMAGPGCAIEAVLGEPGAVAAIDAVQLEQVLVNLVVNARDALPEGGTVTLRLAEESLDAERARALGMLQGPACRIDVEDDGVGMPPEVRERIFEPFFTTKASGRGTGLGLSICRQILRSRGGEIEVQSAPGQGTRVSLWLPRSRERAEPRATTAPLHELPTGKERILLAEDVDELRHVWQRLLGRLGYRVDAVADGVEASERLDAGQRYDLLVSDVVMPRLGGLALAQRFRALHEKAPILLVSAYPGEALDRAALARIGAVLLRKPIDGTEIARRLRALLDGGGEA
ncbi:MAG: PAS domain S-box protein [Myxococcales bacterium]|nr:PAS domain S-box protein [Myxococcales bacterium]